MTSNNQKIEAVNRAVRFTSHALVEIRRFRFLPFQCYSGVLLDISTGGFKLEFTGEIHVKPGAQYWLSIPLAPLGILAPKRIVCQVECRWFDSKRYRIGGVFMKLTRTEQLIIEQVIETLRTKGLVG